MNILFLTVLDFLSIDERGIYTDLLREFEKNNHKIHVISPTEKRKAEPTKLLNDGNVKILKLQIGNIQKTNIIEKGISTLTLETKFKKGIKQYFSDVKFDLVLYSTPPITLLKAVNFVKIRDNAKTYLLLKDIFPQNAVDLGMLNKTGFKGVLYRYFRNKEKALYKASDYIGCMSDANIKFVIDHNSWISIDKVELCPNSIEPISIQIKDKDKIQIRNKYSIPLDKTAFVYGGNLGKPQGIDFLIECIKENENNKESFLLIVGYGTEYNKLRSFFEQENPKNSKLLNQLQKEDYETLANSCDVGLIFLDRRFTIPNFPSRLLSYMQASMPVLAATDVNTDIGNVIESGNFGYWCESGNVNEFNKLIRRLCDINNRARLGDNARKYLEEHYTVKKSYEIIMKHFNNGER